MCGMAGEVSTKKIHASKDATAYFVPLFKKNLCMYGLPTVLVVVVFASIAESISGQTKTVMNATLNP